MALAIPGFDAAAFREGIRLPMRMAQPDDAARRPQFVTVPVIAPGATVDYNGVAWDPDAAVATPVLVALRPLCAVEWVNNLLVEQNFGRMYPQVVHVTLLDEEYFTIEGFTYLNLWLTHEGTPVRFNYRKITQQVSLDSVGVWTIECSTEDTK
jgi:hypothetical protein